MKRLLIIGLLTLVTVVSYALPIECVGTATQVVEGTDTLFIFKDEIHLKCPDGYVDWYRADGSVYASNTDEIYPDEGCYSANGCHFCCQLYKGIDSLAFTVETRCDASVIHITHGDISSRAHTYSLSYKALAWDGEAWYDSAAVMTGKLTKTISLPPLYDSTLVTLCYDKEVRTALGMADSCVEVDVPFDSIKAVNFQMTSLATTRGKEGEKSNERNRPTSQELITGSEYSGALEVAFYANPTPAARFFKWDIYHAAEHLATRRDQDIRYVFTEPGTYRVVCTALNDLCTADSAETTVAIAESYLAVPNVFTPNGDGMNDEFRVAYRSLAVFHIWVYNRWGKLVYESDDPSKGWDGTIGGRNAAEGAYFYVVRALGTDAAKDAKYMSKISYNKKKLNADEAVIGVYQMSGDINLLRGKR